MRDHHPAQPLLRRVAWSAPFLVALADGRARTSRDLASLAGISPGSATRHLRGLRRLGLVAAEPAGRDVGLLFRLTPAGVDWLERPLIESCQTLGSSSRSPKRKRS